MFSYLKELFATAGTGSFEWILICLYIGILLACGAALYDRRLLGNYIRKLVSLDATVPERAVTLKETGFEKSRAVKRALRGNGVFAGTVFEAAETVELDSESHALPMFRESFDPETARFYIPEAVKYRAEVRFERKGSHIMALVLGAILFAVLLVVLILSKDRILGLISDFFNALAA